MSEFQFQNFLPALFLVSGFVLTCPPFSTRILTNRAKLFLILTLSLYLANTIPVSTGLSKMIILFFTSAAFGFCIRILFVVFDLAGELIANGMGLSFPGQISALSSQSTGPIAALGQITGLLAFIELNGLENLIYQLQQLSTIQETFFQQSFATTLSGFLSKSMYTGAMLSISIWLSLLVGHIGLLLASRLSGGLNLMNSGFAILCSVGIIFIALELLPISNRAALFIIETLQSFL